MRRRDFLRAAAGLGLTVGSHETLAQLSAEVPVGTLRGRVRSDGVPLAGVRVSDGRRVALTDGQGRYRLEVGPDSGPFLFVSTPRGYWTDEFYAPLATVVEAGAHDFALRPMRQADRFRCVFIADMHLEGGGHRIPKMMASIAEINALQPRPAFVWAQGDICLQGHAGEDYLRCMSRLRMPVRNGPGNHEMMMAEADPKAEYRALFGPPYYSFDWGRVHFIVLDGNKVIPGDSGWENVHGIIEGTELEWLRADLASTPSDMAILAGIHIPIASTYPERRGHEPKGAPYWEVINDEEVMELLAAHNVRAVFQGHMHENERLTVKGVEFVESISLAGSWWQSGEGFERAPDGVPRGYRIIEVDGVDARHRFYSSAESHVDREAEFVGLEQGLAARRDARLVLNCYDAPNEAVAEVRIDGGRWRSMPTHGRINGAMGLTMPHHYALSLNATRLSPGEHTVEARVRWPGGEVRHSQSFYVRESILPRPDELTESAEGWSAEGTCGVSADIEARVGERSLRFELRTADYAGEGCDIRRSTPPLDLTAIAALRFWMRLEGLGEGQYVHFQLRSGGAVWNFQREGDTQPRGNFDWQQLELALTDPPVGFDLGAVDMVALILQGAPQGGQVMWLDGLEFVGR